MLQQEQEQHQQQLPAAAELQCLGGSAAGLLPYPDGAAAQSAAPISVVRPTSLQCKCLRQRKGVNLQTSVILQHVNTQTCKLCQLPDAVQSQLYIDWH